MAADVTAADARTGFHGKLPTAGDFVQRRLSPAFVSVWDRSFEMAIAASRQRLGADWMAAYRSSPIWRFQISAGVCGSSAFAGVVGPGHDRVGRCFPLVIAREIGPDPQLPLRVLAMSDWFDALHEAMQRALHHGTPMDNFDREIAALDHRFGHLPEAWSLLGAIDLRAERHWRVALPAAEAASIGLLQTAWRRAVEGGACAMWWTEGGERVPATLFVTGGLPAGEAYTAFLDAGVALDGWQTLGRYAARQRAAAAAPPAVAVTETAAEPAVSATWLALARGAGSAPVAAGSPPPDVLDELFGPGAAAETTAPATPALVPASSVAGSASGSVSAPAAAAAAAFDADSTVPGFAARAAAAPPTAPKPPAAAARVPCARLQSSDGRFTLVAADVGGEDRSGAAASAVADSVAQLPAEGLSAGIDAIRARLLSVHQHLRARADDLISPMQIDCAVAVATVEDGHAAVLLTGAATALLWRGERLQPVAELAGGVEAADDLDDLLFAAAEAGAGLGSERSPGFVRHQFALESGDRLLLITAPAVASIDPAALARAMALPTPIDAEARLAADLGYPPDQSLWPFVVVEVQP